jgi:hypothetical protein
MKVKRALVARLVLLCQLRGEWCRKVWKGRQTVRKAAKRKTTKKKETRTTTMTTKMKKTTNQAQTRKLKAEASQAMKVRLGRTQLALLVPTLPRVKRPRRLHLILRHLEAATRTLWRYWSAWRVAFAVG